MQNSYFIFHDNKLLIDNEQTFAPLSKNSWTEIAGSVEQQTLLALHDEQETHIIELADYPDLGTQYKWVTLRSMVGHVTDSLFSHWSKASQILHWQKSSKYCGSCGSETTQHPKDLAKICPACNTSIYPQVIPCIIVLICKGDEVLLARAPHFPEDMFSTLAGFIEPGETAEETVKREIFEEVQIRVKNIRYFSSQPWPFPGQLMLGFFADYESGEISADGVEICEANWYHYSSLPRIPNGGTIAGRLIRHQHKKLLA